MPSNPYPDNPRWALAEDITDAVRRRHPADVQAVGVHGSLAHGDDTDGSDVDLVVVTFRAGTGPRPGSRRVGGVIVELGVIAGDDYLEYGRTLATSWPLTADQYLTTKSLYDPRGWYDRLRDAHLARLAEANSGEFATLARTAWCQAETTYARAIRLAERHDTAGALLALGEARVSAALVEGLLTRTYFRGGADAMARTGLGDADLGELGRRLRAQAEELDRHGRPVDATVDDLVS